jgi:hypothetical protein
MGTTAGPTPTEASILSSVCSLSLRPVGIVGADTKTERGVHAGGCSLP